LRLKVAATKKKKPSCVKSRRRIGFTCEKGWAQGDNKQGGKVWKGEITNGNFTGKPKGNAGVWGGNTEKTHAFANIGNPKGSILVQQPRKKTGDGGKCPPEMSKERTFVNWGGT